MRDLDVESGIANSVEAGLRNSKFIAEAAIESGAIQRTGNVWKRVIGSRPALIVADANTMQIAGKEAAHSLAIAGIESRFRVLDDPYPDRALADRLADDVSGGECILAVGSGVITDLAKYASYSTDSPYVCLATAASMDGYASFGAPLSDRGFKKTIGCTPPAAVIGDLDIIAAAPGTLTSSGFADLAGKVPAGADWIVADQLGIEPIDDLCYSMVQDYLASALSEHSAVGAGEPGAVRNLFRMLLLVGFAMEMHSSSRPASGADHQIAHVWEMENLTHKGSRVSHGFCVAIGCLASLQLYEWLLERDLSVIDADAVVSSAESMDGKIRRIRAIFDSAEVSDRSIAETKAKHLTESEHRDRLGRIAAAWPELTDRLSGQLIPSEQMREMLSSAGAPTSPVEIGVTGEHMRSAVWTALFIRSRYTVLDLLYETGLLEDAVAEVFA